MNAKGWLHISLYLRHIFSPARSSRFDYSTANPKLVSNIIVTTRIRIRARTSARRGMGGKEGVGRLSSIGGSPCGSPLLVSVLAPLLLGFECEDEEGWVLDLLRSNK